MKPAIEIMQERAATATRELLSRVPAGSVRAVFAGGSVGRDEVWARADGATLAIYSDLDLYVVLAENADEPTVRRVAALIDASVSREQDGVVFHRGVDAGVYRLDDLLAQPVRPGTVDLADRHLWLHGDRSIIEPLRAAWNRPMAVSEALYLLENRAWDALDAVADTTPRATATAAKVVLDVLAAHLIAETRFRPSYAARRQALTERAPSSMPPRDLDAIAIAERVRSGDFSQRVEPVRALAMVATSWLSLAPKTLGAPPSTCPADLLSARCRRGAWAANYREFVQLRRSVGMSLPAAIACAWRYAALSPHTALRTHALVRALTECAGVAPGDVAFHEQCVARLASSLGRREGTLDERARAALRMVS